jgi:hypothetical protein
MPLQKILFKPGINRENTRYTSEGGWYDGDKIRFRQGTPEMIGGWQQLSTATYLGVCRSLWTWDSLNGSQFTGVGTNLKFYVEYGSAYYDITPIRVTTTINNNPFALTASTTVTVTDTAHGCVTGDFVTFSGATAIGSAGTNVTASVLNQEFQVTVIDANTYTITISVVPNATAIAGSPGGGASVVAAYQVNTGPATEVPLAGWGAGGWGLGTWGNSETGNTPMRIWSQTNWGQNLVYSPNRGTIYYWDITTTTSARGVAINTGLGGTFTATNSSVTGKATVLTFSSLTLSEGSQITISGGSLPSGLAAGTYYIRNPAGNTANVSSTAAGSLISTTSTGSGNVSNLLNVPVAANFVFVSDTYRFLMAFGSNPLDSTTQDRMVIRWADQESLTDWYPSTTNQAGELRLSHGSTIVTAVQTRQEIFTITDSSAYSLQYAGPPYVWTAQLMADNISIAGQNAAVIASGVVYWMGVDKFYRYDGRIQTLRCDIREYIFNDINIFQGSQIFAGTVESFNEVWWFYCSKNSTTVDRYAVYNYAEDIWYYGTMARTAWLDSGLSPYPIATGYENCIIQHEYGLNDNATGTPAPIAAYITSSEFDIGDGHNFGFVWRMLPDITFRGSSADAPSVTMSLYPLQNSGSGYLVPASEGGTNYAAVTQQQTVNVEAFTGQVYVRVRGRQMAFKVNSAQLDTTWQLGAPRIDIKPDGRR